MADLYLIFSHTLTTHQIVDAEEKLQVENIVSLPESLQKKWSHINPSDTLDTKNLNKITKWLKEVGNRDDFILIQGEFGATVYLVDFCFKNRFIPIYATSKRMYEEKRNPDGTVERRHIFKHVNFREYRRWESK